MADKKKLESTFINMFVVLLAISLVSALAIGFTYTKTKPAADAIQKTKFENAIREVVPEFDRLGEKKEVDECVLYTAYKGEAVAGTAVETVSHKGFGGDVQLLVGFDAEGKIHNTAVLSIKETPGLGSNMTNPRFKEQVNGKDPENFKLSVKKDGGDVDAITAATITSRAFSKAVDKAYKAFEANKAQFMNNAPVKEEAPIMEEIPAEENNEMEGGQSNE